MAKISEKTVEKIMKENNAKRIGNDAKELVSAHVSEIIKRISVLAARNAGHFGRKTITKEDIEYALSNI